MTSLSPAQARSPVRVPGDPWSAAVAVAGADAWDYLGLAEAAEVAVVWAAQGLEIVALGERDPGGESDGGAGLVGWPREFGGRTFTGAPGRGEWAGWPGSWRLRPRLIYLSRRTGEVWRLGPGPSAPPPPPKPWVPLETAGFAAVEEPAAWIAAATAATATIARGAAQKIVLARRERLLAPGIGERGLSLLPVLRSRHPEAVCFGVKLRRDLGWFVGATPETLVSLHGGRLETEALAGTHLRPEALDNPKDRGEHQWVVDGIEAALAGVSVGLEREGPVSKRAGHLYHLQTRFRGRVCPGYGLFELAERLAPTPAVGGAPRAAALEFIATHEPGDRGGYAGLLGWVAGDGDGHAVVPLRCALLRGDAVYVYGGAGLVAASEPAREWRETAAKLETCKRALAAGGPGR